jgi:hypothetical protein
LTRGILCDRGLEYGELSRGVATRELSEIRRGVDAVRMS